MRGELNNLIGKKWKAYKCNFNHEINTMDVIEDKINLENKKNNLIYP